ncbi:hypothetical protein LPJ66_005421 [Kickxella alabastrina]|uniref:Uncharacterized protein n=1 Tax=Kickxella alabastrina TaxID=61397 RepID=A0ACC1IGY5_9FUNG|nr:hypothetical protein LPJ66_005421 [Kickxella alabastrina]
MLLDTLPSNIHKQILQYLRSWDYTQTDLRSLSQVSRHLRNLTLPSVYEYFTLTDIILSQDYGNFSAVQPHLSRVLVADDPEISDDQWVVTLDELERMSWEHVRMVSVELEGLRCRQGAECRRRILAFVHGRLGHVAELWVGLGAGSSEVERFFTSGGSGAFAQVEELRVIGKTMGAEVLGMQIPEYPHLTVVYLDGSAARSTDILEVVRRSSSTLADLNMDEFQAEMAVALGMSPLAEPSVVYPVLRRLAVSSANDHEGDLLDGRSLPAVASLYCSQTQYPVYSGSNIISNSTQVRLLRHPWPAARCLAVDALSRGDLLLLGESLPQLQVLSVGALGGDVHLGDIHRPAAALQMRDLGAVLSALPGLVDLRIEVPEPYEDMYTGLVEEPGNAVDRPADPLMLATDLVPEPHLALRHLTVNAWALTFDQILGVIDALPQLNALECVLLFSSRHPATRQIHAGGNHLASVSLAHTVPLRMKHVFKANLLRFAGALAGKRLRALDVYGALEITGIEKTLERALPGCVTNFYPLVPSFEQGYE